MRHTDSQEVTRSSTAICSGVTLVDGWAKMVLYEGLWGLLVEGLKFTTSGEKASHFAHTSTNLYVFIAFVMLYTLDDIRLIRIIFKLT